MTAPTGSSAETASVHAPKVELFDVAAMINTDPKGAVRAVREYRVEPFGLFLARDVVDHPRLAAFESWLLPGLGLRATDWFFHPGHERDQDFYLDVVRIDVDAAGLIWRTEDHYLDLVVHTGCWAPRSVRMSTSRRLRVLGDVEGPARGSGRGLRGQADGVTFTASS